jgi:ATP-dependent Clp protease ATP-binding subunit ClpA
MFERFTRDARTAVVLGQEEARMLGDRSIGTEHLLIGLAGTGNDSASRALRDNGVTAKDLRWRLRSGTGAPLDSEALASLGIDLEQVTRAVEEQFGSGALDSVPPGRSPRGHISFSVGGKKSLELAVRAAVAMRSRSISSGHLLIGILDEGKGLGAFVLTDSGVDVDQLRTDIVAHLREEAA